MNLECKHDLERLQLTNAKTNVKNLKRVIWMLKKSKNRNDNFNCEHDFN